MDMQDPTAKRFLVALSFPSEHRQFVRNVAKRLAELLTRDRVFFDEWHRAQYLGYSADQSLAQVYRDDSLLIVPFFSAHYEKPWCNHEWHAIRSVLSDRRRANAVLPVHLDGTRINGWENINVGIRKGRKSGMEIADEICAILKQRSYPDPESANPADPQRKAIAAHSEKLLQRYLKQLRDASGRLRVPVAHAETPGSMHVSEFAPIRALIVDLPLSVVVDPVAQHESQRQSGIRHTARVSQERPSQAARVVCRIGDRLLPGTKPTVLIGQPGCGKSTLFNWVVYSLASRALGADDAAPEPRDQRPVLSDLALGGRLLPIVIVCREIQGSFGSGTSINLAGLLNHQLGRAVYTDDERHVLVEQMLTALNSGGAMLLIDGLDEIHPQTRRREFAQLISNAAQRTGCRVVVTCRVIGYEAVREELRDFEPVMVDPIPPATAEHYVRLWAATAGLPNVDGMLVHLQRPDVMALTENALMLVLITQMIAAEEEVPKRKVDVLRRLCEVMLASRGGNDPARQNEVFPHLERLAYAMRTGGPDGAGVQRFTELEVLSVFRSVREAEPNESSLSARSTGDLLNDIIEQAGLLNVVGWQEDASGFNRRVIQFFHQLVQEYFAGLAIVHGRTPHGHRGHAQIAAMLSEPVPGYDDGRRVSPRALGNVGHGHRVEPVIAERWQEVIPLAIASMRAPADADAALAEILPSTEVSPDEARARAVLALRCLAESPRVTGDTAATVVRVALDQIRAPDGNQNALLTQMDLAISAIARSSLFDFVRERLLDVLMTSDGDRQLSVCLIFSTLIEQGVDNTSMFSPAHVVSSADVRALVDELGVAADDGDDRRAIEIGTRVLVAFYTLQLKSDRHALDAADSVAHESLIEFALRPDLNRTVRSLVLWSLTWLTGTRSPDLYTPRPCTAAEAERLSELLIGKQDELVLGWTAAMISGAAPKRTARGFDRNVNDWIYEGATVADGNRPQRHVREAFDILKRRVLPTEPRPTGERQLVERLLIAMDGAESQIARQQIARALCAFDIVIPAMTKPLYDLLSNDLADQSMREEALLFLIVSETPEASRCLARAVEADSGIDSFLQLRGLIGCILAGDVGILTEMAARGDEHNQQLSREFAYALAGMATPAAEAALDLLAEHDDETVRRAVRAAREKVPEWLASSQDPMVFKLASDEATAEEPSAAG